MESNKIANAAFEQGTMNTNSTLFTDNATIEKLCLIQLLIQPKPNERILEIRRHNTSWMPSLFDEVELYIASDHQSQNGKHQKILVNNGSKTVFISDYSQMPFQQLSFDYILLAPDFFESSLEQASASQKNLTALFSELYRILKNTGRMIGCFRNRWGHNHLQECLSNKAGYTSYFRQQVALKNSGFNHVDFFPLDHGGHAFSQQITILKHKTLLGTEVKTSLKNSLKTGLLAPHLIFSASGNTAANEYPYARTQSFIKKNLEQEFGNCILKVDSHTVSRKEKIIYIANWGGQKLIIKTPFSQAARASEQNNFQCLEHLSKCTGLKTTVPHPIASRTNNTETFFIESALPGVALASISEKGSKVFDPFSIAHTILDDMFTQTRKNQVTNTRLDIYSCLVQAKIDRLHHYTQDSELKIRLQDYFSVAINWEELPTGICHGDFSVSNIMSTPNGDLGLIDWETADLNGLPVLDAINFLDSYFRLTVKGCRVNKSIPALAKEEFPDQTAKKFMTDAYRLYSIDPSNHQTLVYLRWLHHASYLIQFWLQFDRKSQNTYIYDIVKTLPST